MAGKNFQADDDIIDLTELIESSEPAPKAAAKKAQAEDFDMGADDVPNFDDILSDTQTSSANNRPLDPSEELDMTGLGGIDNLLESLDIPPQPRQMQDIAEEDDEPKEMSSEDLGFSDLDNVLDDLLNDTGGQKTEKPKKAESKKQAAAKPAEKAAPAKKAAPAGVDDARPMPDIDAELDSILSSVEPPAMPEQEVAASGMNDKELDSDSVDFMEDTLKEFESSYDNAMPENGVQQTVKNKDENLLPGADGSSDDADDMSGISAELPDDLDAMIDDKKDFLNSAETVNSTVVAHHAANKNSDTEYWAKDTVQTPAQAVMQPVLTQDLLTAVCKNLASMLNGTVQESLQNFARQLGSQTASLENVVLRAAELDKRINALEAKLSSAKTRISVLENAPSGAALLQEMFKPESSFARAFCESAALAAGTAIQKSFPQGRMDKNQEFANSDANGSIERLEILENRFKSLEERDQEFVKLECQNENLDKRIENLEKKIGNLEQNFNAAVEKAASQAVARILHEEISKLLAS